MYSLRLNSPYSLVKVCFYGGKASLISPSHGRGSSTLARVLMIEYINCDFPSLHHRKTSFGLAESTPMQARRPCIGLSPPMTTGGVERLCKSHKRKDFAVFRGCNKFAEMLPSGKGNAEIWPTGYLNVPGHLEIYPKVFLIADCPERPLIRSQTSDINAHSVPTAFSLDPRSPEISCFRCTLSGASLPGSKQSKNCLSANI